MPMSDEAKRRYVLKKLREQRDGAHRPHGCHWPGCTAQVPPAAWGCKRHWQTLPPVLRRKVWAAYRPGQEETLTPSGAYLEVAEEIQQWIVNYLKPKESAK